MRVINGDLLISGSLGDQRGNMNGAATLNSAPFALHHLQGYSVQASYGTIGASGVTGSFKLQASNDRSTTNFTNPNQQLTNWTDITGTTQAIQASGSNNTVMWNVGGAYYSFVRLVYTNTAGSGSLDVRISGKAPA